MRGWNNPTVRTTAEGEQVGPRMHKCIKAAQGGSRKCDDAVWPSKNQLAIQIGPNGSQDYGYRVVNRCLSKGLLELEKDHEEATPSSRGAVKLTDKGQRYLNNHN